MCTSTPGVRVIAVLSFVVVPGVTLTSVRFNFILQIDHILRHLLLALKEWNKQDFSHLYCNTKEQWFIFPALNHTNVLPVAGTTIIATCGGFAVSTGLSPSTPTYFPTATCSDPGVVISASSEPTTGSDPSTRSAPSSFFVPSLDSSDGYGFPPSHVSDPVPTSFPSISGSVPSLFYSVVPGGVSHLATGFTSSPSAFFHRHFFPSTFSASMLFCCSFFDSSPSASESGGGTAATKATKATKTATKSATKATRATETATETKTETKTEPENRSNEDDVQSIIVGKSLAPNVFLSHKFFPRWRTSRVVNL